MMTMRQWIDEIKRQTTQADRWVKQRFERLQPYRHYAVQLETWNSQYRGLEWDWLNDLDELGRYAMIAGYIRRLKPGGSVLDVGCGVGLLQQQLAGGYTRYLGIDISVESLKMARLRQNASTHFLVADGATFVPPYAVDTVVFNECLYYFEHPFEVVAHYRSFLKRQGLVIISMYHETTPRRIWAGLSQRFRLVDGIRLEHVTGKGWTVKVFTVTGDNFV